MIAGIIMVLSLLLDGILTNFTSYMQGDLSLFYPMLTLVSLIIIYPFFQKDRKKYLLSAFVLGIIYDLFYTNLFIFNGVIFVIMGLLIIFIYKNIPTNFLTIILYAVVVIISYEALTSLIFIISQLETITLIDILYKIGHSLILNIIYVELLYLIMKLIPKKYTKLKIN